MRTLELFAGAGGASEGLRRGAVREALAELERLHAALDAVPQVARVRA